VAGEGRAQPAGNAGMTDDEMAWLSGQRDTRPPPPPPAPPEPPPPPAQDPVPDATVESWPGSTTDAEAAAAALAAVEGSATAPRRLDEGPDELPPLPGQEEPLPEETGPGEPAPAHGPGPARVALAAVLVLAAGLAAAWQLGWLPGETPPAPSPPPPLAAAAPPPAEPAPTAASPDPAAGSQPPAEAGPVDVAPPDDAAPTGAPPAAEAPAPAPGPARRPARISDSDRSRRNLRIGRKDRRLLDLLEKKGDASPVTSVEPSTLDTGLATLDVPAVERTIADNRPAFAACVTRALKADPTLRIDEQKATLLLTLRPSGTVSRAWIAEADLEAQPLGRCLVAAARRMVFPAFQGDALDVAAPLVLGAIR
jgi:hypothetical protein